MPLIRRVVQRTGFDSAARFGRRGLAAWGLDRASILSPAFAVTWRTLRPGRCWPNLITQVPGAARPLLDEEASSSDVAMAPSHLQAAIGELARSASDFNVRINGTDHCFTAASPATEMAQFATFQDSRDDEVVHFPCGVSLVLSRAIRECYAPNVELIDWDVDGGELLREVLKAEEAAAKELGHTPVLNKLGVITKVNA
eukprot:g21845.t1